MSRGWEAAGWCVAAATVVALNVARAGGPRLSNDSYQYLSVTESLWRGEGLRTPLVHYDADYRQRHIPVRLTAFPPGYPLAIVPFRALGLDGETAGLCVSALSFVLLVPLLWLAAGWLQLPPTATRAMLVLLVANGHASWLSGFVLSESLFTLLTTATLVAALRATPASVAAAGLCAGLAFSVRFAGIFVAFALMAFYGWRLLARRTAAAWRELGAAALALLFVGAWLVHSLFVNGTLKGGNTKAIYRGLAFVGVDVARSFVQLFLLPADRPPRLVEALPLGLIALAVAVVVWLSWRAWAAPPPSAARRTLPLLGLVAALYMAGIAYLELTAPINTGVRMFYPLLPLIALAVGLALQRAEAGITPEQRRRYVGALALGLGAYAFLQQREAVLVRPAGHRLVQARLAQPTVAGPTLAEWIEEHIPPQAVIIAVDGQATGYALRRPTLSLPAAEISDQVWSEGRIRELFETYDAELLLLYPNVDLVWPTPQTESPFLAGLLTDQLPEWLVLAAAAPRARAYRRAAAGATTYREPPAVPR